MLLATGGLVEIARGLRESFDMFWQIFWALTLGFLISGAAQQFIPRRQIERLLGTHRPLPVLRAAAFGMVSSSCSYAASAMARRLFQLGADFITSIVFMVASTNLVVELGIVIAVLLGWQFVVGEYVGAVVMIVMLAGAGSLLLGARAVASARLASGSPDVRETTEDMTAPAESRGAAWAGAASFAISDIAMLKKEIVGGLLAAGLLAEIVPSSWWGALFLHGSGLGAAIEGALVGPIIAAIACVCSIGNVPLGATLWHGGISFGGVIAFIFADLLAAPLLLTYRRYYGGRVTVRIALALYVSTVIAALAVQGLFTVIGIVPHRRDLAVFSSHPAFDATTALDIAAAVLLGAAYLAHRSHSRQSTDSRFAIDPICHMRVAKADAPAHVHHDGADFYFCSQGCAQRFTAAHAGQRISLRDRD